MRAIYPWNPILFRSYITASFMGIVNDSRTKFDERFKVKEDYELTLRCVKKDGGVVAARYLFWENPLWTDAGAAGVCGRCGAMGIESIFACNLLTLQ